MLDKAGISPAAASARAKKAWEKRHAAGERARAGPGAAPKPAVAEPPGERRRREAAARGEEAVETERPAAGEATTEVPPGERRRREAERRGEAAAETARPAAAETARPAAAEEADPFWDQYERAEAARVAALAPEARQADLTRFAAESRDAANAAHHVAFEAKSQGALNLAGHALDAADRAAERAKTGDYDGARSARLEAVMLAGSAHHEVARATGQRPADPPGSLPAAATAAEGAAAAAEGGARALGAARAKPGGEQEAAGAEEALRRIVEDKAVKSAGDIEQRVMALGLVKPEGSVLGLLRDRRAYREFKGRLKDVVREVQDRRKRIQSEVARPSGPGGKMDHRLLATQSRALWAAVRSARSWWDRLLDEVRRSEEQTAARKGAEGGMGEVAKAEPALLDTLVREFASVPGFPVDARDFVAECVDADARGATLRSRHFRPVVDRAKALRGVSAAAERIVAGAVAKVAAGAGSDTGRRHDAAVKAWESRARHANFARFSLRHAATFAGSAPTADAVQMARSAAGRLRQAGHADLAARAARAAAGLAAGALRPDDFAGEMRTLLAATPEAPYPRASAPEKAISSEAASTRSRLAWESRHASGERATEGAGTGSAETAATRPATEAPESASAVAAWRRLSDAHDDAADAVRAIGAAGPDAAGAARDAALGHLDALVRLVDAEAGGAIGEADLRGIRGHLDEARAIVADDRDKDRAGRALHAGIALGVALDDVEDALFGETPAPRGTAGPETPRTRINVRDVEADPHEKAVAPRILAEEIVELAAKSLSLDAASERARKARLNLRAGAEPWRRTLNPADAEGAILREITPDEASKRALRAWEARHARGERAHEDVQHRSPYHGGPHFHPDAPKLVDAAKRGDVGYVLDSGNELSGILDDAKLQLGRVESIAWGHHDAEDPHGAMEVHGEGAEFGVATAQVLGAAADRLLHEGALTAEEHRTIAGEIAEARRTLEDDRRASKYGRPGPHERLSPEDVDADESIVAVHRLDHVWGRLHAAHERRLGPEGEVVPPAAGAPTATPPTAETPPATASAEPAPTPERLREMEAKYREAEGALEEAEHSYHLADPGAGLASHPIHGTHVADEGAHGEAVDALRQSAEHAQRAAALLAEVAPSEGAQAAVREVEAAARALAPRKIRPEGPPEQTSLPHWEDVEGGAKRLGAALEALDALRDSADEALYGHAQRAHEMGEPGTEPESQPKPEKGLALATGAFAVIAKSVEPNDRIAAADGGGLADALLPARHRPGSRLAAPNPLSTRLL